MSHFQVTRGRKLVLGMVHLAPLPGTPFFAPGSLQEIIDTAVSSAVALDQNGADGCLVQTVDRVYSVTDESDPARIAAMSLITRAIVEATGETFQVGVHMLRNALRASLAVAKTAGGSYIRAGAIVGQTLTTHGMVSANPLDTMDYRAKIDARSIAIIADVESMHFHWPAGEKTVPQVAAAAMNVGADAVAISHPDEARAIDMIDSVRKALPDVPIILAGDTRHENAARLLRHADGAFVGRCLEKGGWGGAIDPGRVRDYVGIARSAEVS